LPNVDGVLSTDKSVGSGISSISFNIGGEYIKAEKLSLSLKYEV